jgi:CRISPR-associated protein (TIGR02584 family)
MEDRYAVYPSDPRVVCSGRAAWLYCALRALHGDRAQQPRAKNENEQIEIESAAMQQQLAADLREGAASSNTSNSLVETLSTYCANR